MKSGSIKKWLGIVVRLAVAAAGLGYVAATLTWTDSVELPAGYAVADRTFEQIATLPVAEQTSEHYRLRAADGGLFDLPVDKVTQEEGDPAFRPGIVTTCADAKISYLLIAMLLVAPTLPLMGARWNVLMRCRGIRTTFMGAFRLQMVGYFFNTFMPGMTGGDVMKAYYVARGREQKTAAVISVLVDRVIGMSTLVVLGAVAGAFAFHRPESRDAVLNVWIVLAVAIVGAALYFSHTVRRWIGYNRLINLLGENNLLRRADEAAFAYRDHKLAVLGAVSISLPVPVFFIMSGVFSGWAVGLPDNAPMLVTLLAILPLIVLIGALPISFMGFGVMEPAGIALLAAHGPATPNQVVTMLVLMRIYQILYSVLGAMFLIRGHLSIHPEDIAE